MTYTTTYPDPNADYRVPEETVSVDTLTDDYKQLVSFLKELCTYKLEKFGELVEEANRTGAVSINFDPENALSCFEDQCMEEWGEAVNQVEE